MMEDSLVRTMLTLLLYILASASLPAYGQSIQDILDANNGISTEQGRDAAWYLAQHKNLTAALDTLKPQIAGVVDAYLLVVGLDGDAVFQREAAEAEKVLSRRYNTAGRSILLSTGSTKYASGSPANISAALGAIASKMNVEEDVLILYTTSHGSDKVGLLYKDGNNGFGMITPTRLLILLNSLQIKRRILMISACYSGVFIPSLESDDSIIITAASAKRTSFGCTPGNDWTFFGDALINNALRAPQPLDAATTQMTKLVKDWENQLGLDSSDPQISIGDNVAPWLKALEARIPKDQTQLVGTSALKSAAVLVP
jgi:Peptidase C13 family